MSKRILVALLLLLPVQSGAQEQPLPTVDAVVAMLQKGQAEMAERELRRILASSESSAARDLLGVVLSRQGRFEEAETEFSRAAALAPDLSAPRQHLGRLFLQQGRTEEALTELRAAAVLGPLERDLALSLADAELSLGNESAAEVQLLSVAERFESVRALLQLARLHGRRGQNQSAAEIVQRALEIAPNSEKVLTARAKVSLAVEAPVLAIQALEPLTRMHPADAEPNYILGIARLQIGDMAGSIEALQRSLELAPGRPLALVALGMTLNAQKRFEEAKSVAFEGIRLDPESTEGLAVLAAAEEGLGEFAQAEKHAAQVLAREPEHARALATIGQIRMTQQRYEEARDSLLRSAASAPGTSRTHYQLSLVFARLGDRESSREHLELYRRYRKESDERLIELRTRAGLGISGMGRS